MKVSKVQFENIEGAFLEGMDAYVDKDSFTKELSSEVKHGLNDDELD